MSNTDFWKNYKERKLISSENKSIEPESEIREIEKINKIKENLIKK